MINVNNTDQVQNQAKPWYKVTYIQVLIAIFAGGLLGYLNPVLGASFKPLGDAFISIIKMIIAPVIFVTIVTGIAGMSDLKKVGRVAGKTFLYFLVFSTLALIIGLIVGNLLQPGKGINANLASLDTAAVSGYINAAHDTSIKGFLLSIIPKTTLSPLIGDNILQVLFVAILFGVSLVLVGEHGKPVIRFFEALSFPIFKMVEILMKLAPIGAFGAMAFTIGKFGIGSIVNLIFLVACFYITSLIFVLVVLGAVARYNGFKITKLIKYIRAELLLVLGTSSSESALPSLMKKMERAGCGKGVVGLVIPTGYSFNLDGTNIYMTMVALFIAQACNINLTLEHQLLLLVIAMISSKGAAGVTGAGFITLAATLAVVPEIPVAGMALILGIDRFMSECRALTNFVGNATAAVVVARWENQLDAEQLERAFNGEDTSSYVSPFDVYEQEEALATAVK